MKRGVLLINLGSPDSPTEKDVRTYLREFLSDDRVIDVPKLIQQAVLNFAILPRRPKESAEAYQEIWTDEGSPLIVITQRQRDALRERIDLPVEMGMRYGNPSTAESLRRLAAQGVDEIFVIPLYPHYAMSSYETAVAKVLTELQGIAPKTRVIVQPPYYEDEDFVAALVAQAKPYLDEDDWDALLFSYHGIPERHVKQTDPTGCWCLQNDYCCDVDSVAHATCYRAQCFATTRKFAELAGLDKTQWRLSFQSRLGREPWLKPYTDFELEKFPTQGIKRLLVMCPAFVSDCLETLEEIEMRGKEDFEKAGGLTFRYIPCVNESPEFIDVLERMVGDFLSGALEKTAKSA